MKQSFSEILVAIENRNVIQPQSSDFRFFEIALLSLTKAVFTHNWKMIGDCLPFVLLTGF